MVAHHVRGFDHDAEAAKIVEHGAEAAAARLQFRPPLPAAGERPQPTGFLLEGHPLPEFSGVYRLESEHEGWPVLRNGRGRFCYRYTRESQWRLSSRHRPTEDRSNSNIDAPDGRLPTGQHLWRCCVDKVFSSRTLTVTLLPTAAEVAAAEGRIRQAQRALDATKAALGTSFFQIRF